jgi:alpha-ribazole phosphatase
MRVTQQMGVLRQPQENKKRAIYLLRHGELDLMGERRFVGQVDPPLSEKGLEQARFWWRELASEEFDRICCSDLIRSHQTAKIIAGDKRERIEIVPQLREIDLGAWDGLRMAEVQERFPLEWERRGEDLTGYRPPGGESFADLQDRAVPVFDELTVNSSGNVLVVGHAGVNRVILCHILGIPLNNLFRLAQDYAHLSIVDCNNEPPRLAALNIAPADSRKGEGSIEHRHLCDITRRCKGSTTLKP